MPSPTELRRALYVCAQEKNFVDPITELAPNSEESLSGILAIKAQQLKVRWAEISLYSPTFESSGNALSIIDERGAFASEYRLLHSDGQGAEIWQGMPSDIVHISSSGKNVVIFENKIGSRVGYESQSPVSNQFARQMDFLISLSGSHIEKVAYVLISTRYMLENCWYLELDASLEHAERRKKLPTYAIAWEDIFDATAP